MSPHESHKTSLFEQTLEELEWNKIKFFLSEQCNTFWGRELAKILPFCQTKQEAEKKYAQLRDALLISYDRGESIPLSHFGDIEPSIERLEKSGTLYAEELRNISFLLQNVGELKTFFKTHQEIAPILWEMGQQLEPLLTVRQEINHCIDSHGFIKDDASWELQSLREKVRSAHQRLKTKIQGYLQSSLSDYLTDTYYTLREDRYVLPVRSSDKSKVPGILYGSSASGQTVFIEPQEMVQLNNGLRFAESDVTREEQRILEELSRLVGQHTETLKQNLEWLLEIDLLQAKVRFAEALDATLPILTGGGEEAEFDLKSARHPLLVLRGIDVVPNDLKLGKENRILLLSGPNTGGKTITLKTFGLFALFARASLPVPARVGSVVPFLKQIYTDIGDQQSIEMDLSTFSAQIITLKKVLQKANDETLLLIDEIIVGTNPKQGSCLAQVIMEELATQGTLVVATTHYEELKMLPMQDARFQNASVGFQLETLEPTYKVQLGSPGASSGLEIARRLGLPASICNKAEALIPYTSERFEQMMNRLEQQYQEIFAERERLQKARQEAEKKQLSIQQKEEKITTLQERIEQEKEQVVIQEINEARELIRKAKKMLEATHRSSSQVQLSENLLNEAKKKVRGFQEQSFENKKSKRKTKGVSSLEKGARVHIVSMNTKGEVLEANDMGQRALVLVGSMKMFFGYEDLEKSRQEPSPKKRNPPNPSKKEEEEKQEIRVIFQTSENTCDLRGLRADEAIEKVENFFDDSVHNGIQTIILIHGHGTGALRSSVRDFCKHSRYVLSSRSGQQNEGGEGVTIVNLQF